MTDYTDLKRRLAEIHGGETILTPRIFATIHQSAAAIDALEAEVARLRAALKSCPPTSNPTVTAQEHLDRINAWWRLEARAALADQPAEGGK